MSPRWNDGKRFGGRIVVVTGANGALGSVIASRFGLEGATVVLAVRNSRDVAETALADIESAGGSGHLGALDVTDRTSIKAFIADTVKRYGGIDMLVNAAGRIDPADIGRLDEIDPDAWDRLFEVDVKGTMMMCQAVAPSMRERGGGAIVNFSGSYGNGTDPENNSNCIPVQYCAAKGAIRAFTMTVARDLAPYGIRVNAISPGMIEANWADDWGIDMEGEDMKAAFNSLSIRRLGVPEEIAETVLYLASDGSGYMTGQNLVVDGGWTVCAEWETEGPTRFATDGS